MKQNDAKNYIKIAVCVSSVFHHIGVHRSNSDSEELCNKNCIVKTSETLITWSTSCYTAGSE